VRVDGYGIRLAQRSQIFGRLRNRSGKATVGAIDVKPRTVLPAHGGNIVQRIDGTGAHRASGSNDHARHITRGSVRLELSPQRRHVHAELRVGADPSNRRDPEAAQVGGLLNPGMRLDRPVDAESATGVATDTVLAHIPPGLCQTRSEETHEISHVAAADQQSSAIGRIADQLRDPPYRLRFDFRRGWREDERPDVRIDGRSEKVAEDPDRRRRRGDVPEKARVRVEQRVIEQQSGGLLQQRTRLRTRLWKRPRQAECGANGRRRLPARHGTARHRCKRIR